MKNDLLLRAAKGEHIERPPVWLMRQAGRILPEYRELRASLSGFLELVSNPELVCEVTLQPVRALGVDAAIIFSDILVIPEAMGMPYSMQEQVGPRFAHPLRRVEDTKKLRVADPADLEYVTEGIRRTRQALNDTVPLIGFAGAPWTLMAYMVEGGGSKTFSHARRALYAEPTWSEHLLDKITEGTAAYIQAQVRAGAQLIQLFDSWAGVLTPDQYRRFAIPRLRQLCEAVPEVPVTVFAKDAWFCLEDLGTLPCAVISLDAQTTASTAQEKAPGKVFQGNLDPCLLYASPEQIHMETQTMLRAFGTPHIANLGHGVYPDTPLEGVRAFIAAVQSYRYETSGKAE